MRSRLPKTTEASAQQVRLRFLCFAVGIVAFLISPSPASATIRNGENAIDVLGQFSSYSSDTTADYTHGCVNNGAGPIGFSEPTNVLVDGTYHRLFVMDPDNNRLLVFTLNSSNQISSKTASYVLGQPDFKSCAANPGSLAGFYSSNNPNGDQMAFDSANNRLFAMDYTDEHVLVFNTSTITNGMNASYYLGSGSDTATQSNISPGAGVDWAGGLAFDSANQLLYVADSYFNRVLVFNVATGSIANAENASYVLGQTTFSAGGANEGGSISQSSLDFPNSLALDSTNNLLYVSDNHNNRVMVFPAYGNASWAGNGENASYELGQTNFTTTGGCSAATASGFCAPNGVVFDSTNNRLFVSDTAPNNRVMIFNTASLSNGMNASYALGEPNLTTYNGYTPAVTESTLSNPFGLAYDSANNLLYVADEGFNRIMIFSASTTLPTASLPTTAAGDSCAVAAGGLYCWGINTYGENGNGTTNQSTSPVLSGTATNWIAISEGQADGCGIQGSGSSGSLWCWGRDDDYEDGQGNTTQYTSPVQVGTDTTWSVVSVANANSATTNDVCGIDNGKLYCWGLNNHGEDGQSSTSEITTPTQVGSDTTWTAVSQSGRDACGIDNGKMYCWGRDTHQEDGQGNTTQYTTPQQVSSATNWIYVSQGVYDTCGIQGSGGSGSLWCWGYNSGGELGQGDTTLRGTPTQIGSATNWTAISIYNGGSTGADACGIAGGALYCWGINTDGELGLGPGNTTQYKTPQQVGTDTTWTAISMGNANACGIDNGKLYCWGNNASGQLGVGNTTQYTTPQLVSVGGLTGENAVDELGQYTSTSPTTNSWTTNGADNGPTALGMNGPNAVALDPLNHYLYVTDENNNRVMVYALNHDNSIPTGSGSHSATYVLGQTNLQGGNFYGNGMSQMGQTTGLAFDAVNNRLFVADYANSRVLVFNTSGGVTTGMSASYYLGGVGQVCTQASLDGVGQIAYDAVNSRLFAEDVPNSRVMVFNVAPGSIANSENASYVLGQTSFTSCNANQGGSAGQNTLFNPNGIAYDAANSRLFVGDNQSRIMVFNVAPGTIANGENASYVLGETNFTSTGGTGNAQGGVSSSSGLSYDPNTNRLFVGSYYSNVVMVFNAGPSQISNGMNASYEIGCTTFGTGCAGTTQSRLNDPYQLYYDPGSGRLFVPEVGNNRVTIFDGTTISTHSQWMFIPGYE